MGNFFYSLLIVLFLAGCGEDETAVPDFNITRPDDDDTEHASTENFSDVFQINAVAPLDVARICLPLLKQSERPAILSISSQMSWMGYQKSDHIAYRASKAALNKIMQGLATDLTPDGIPVCVIDPGWVRTDMGGPYADHDVQDVAQGIWKVATNLNMDQTGKFIRWTGEEREY